MTEETQFRAVRLGDLIGELAAENDAAVEARKTGRPRGPVTQIKKLDEALGGFMANGLHIVQAGPGAGKTALSLQIASNCAFPTLYVSAEMHLLELFRRLIARTTSTFLGRLKTGELSTDDVRRLARQTAEQAPWVALLDATRSYVNPTAILAAASAIRERAGSSGVLVVLDSLQYWAKSAGDASEYDLVNAGLRSLCQIASQLSCPVLTISHRNRQGNKGEGGMFSSKGSGEIEYGAESILELSREKDTKPDAMGKVPVSLVVLKNRNGADGWVIPLEFTGRLQLFTEREK
jgi:replicative DNA helicase